MDVRGFTIYEDGSRDLDFSLCVDVSSRGWLVTCCISNVSDAIHDKSVFDKSARARVETTAIDQHRDAPMLPRRFSEVSCSLVQNTSRPVMGVRIRLDHTLEPQGPPTIDTTNLICSANLTYSDIQYILNDTSSLMHSEVSRATALSQSLMLKRRISGASVVYDDRSGWMTDEDGYIRQLVNASEMAGRVIRQEIMILVNTELAKYCHDNNITVPYLNLSMMRPVDDVGNGVAWTAERDTDGDVRYGHIASGHFGLGLEFYLRCTSPLRRYADLVTQRQLLSFVNGSSPVYKDDEIDAICQHINSYYDKKSTTTKELIIARANSNADRSIQKYNAARMVSAEYDRAIKNAAHGGMPSPSVVSTIRNRLKTNVATSTDLYRILFESRWKDVINEILVHLVNNPFLATSICNIASRNLGWGKPSYKISRHGSGGSMLNTAIVHYNGIESSAVTSRSLKHAKHIANLLVICSAINVDPPRWSDSDILKCNSVGIPSTDSSNPIGDLLEYCKAMRWPPPDFSYHVDGNMFTVSCKLSDITVQSSSLPSKKAAKRESAIRAISMLREAVSGT